MSVLDKYLEAKCQAGFIHYVTLTKGPPSDLIDMWAEAFWQGVEAREAQADLPGAKAELQDLIELHTPKATT